jgi:hypothetical protein
MARKIITDKSPDHDSSRDIGSDDSCFFAKESHEMLERTQPDFRAKGHRSQGDERGITGQNMPR